MKNNFFLATTFLLHCWVIVACYQELPVDFDVSMKAHEYARVLSTEPAQVLYNFLKQLYEKNRLERVSVQNDFKIPRYIHIIWLGGVLPQEYERYVKSWIDFHPNWTIVLWVDKPASYACDAILHSFEEFEQYVNMENPAGKKIVVDVKQLSFDNRVFYNQARNYGEKSDILKWQVVYQFGGVYVDVDCECLKPLDELHRIYDFYTGIQPLDTNRVQLGAALFAAIPEHPILKHCVETIKDDHKEIAIIAKTGPLHFTKSFFLVAGKTKTLDIAFPASFFYPCGYDQRGTEKSVWLCPESFAVHHWAGSWLKPTAFERRFLVLKNE